jgi:hypothetical protein
MEKEQKFERRWRAETRALKEGLNQRVLKHGGRRPPSTGYVRN